MEREGGEERENGEEKRIGGSETGRKWGVNLGNSHSFGSAGRGPFSLPRVFPSSSSLRRSLCP